MRKLVLLLEERSMKVLLDGLLPRLYPDMVFQCVPHEGKRDLEKSIPKKLRAWNEPGVKFLVLRDNDGADCQVLKRRLQTLCRDSGRPDSLVRIACQELEAWYFGDPKALALTYSRPDLAKVGAKAKYRFPDRIASPSKSLGVLVPEFQKVSAARRIAPHLSREYNQSPSFCALLQGIDRLRQGTGHQGAPVQGQLNLPPDNGTG